MDHSETVGMHYLQEWDRLQRLASELSPVMLGQVHNFLVRPFGESQHFQGSVWI